MEYTQWVFCIKKRSNTKRSLNPCCNGIYSMSEVEEQEQEVIMGLNPGCNGIYSMSSRKTVGRVDVEQVLILVVMEYTQWEEKHEY